MLPKLEQIEHGARSSFTWRRFRGAGWNFAWHFHPEVELTLITAGQGQRFVGDSIETFKPGDLVLLGSNLPHTWYAPAPTAWAGEPEPGLGVGSVVIQFNRDFAGQEFWRRPEADAVRQLLERAQQGLHFPTNHRGVADLMAAMHHQDGWGRLLTLLKMLGELASDPDAGRPLSDVAHALPPRRDDQPRIDIACRLIAERYTQPLNQAQVADAIHLSPSSFSRFFKRMTGRTFVGYVHELRIADACRRLAESDQPITQICFDCGFDNISNFNRVFRKLRSISPRDYRKTITQPHPAPRPQPRNGSNTPDR